MAKQNKIHCRNCETPFIASASEIKRGKAFCCWDCYLKAKEKANEEMRNSRKCANDECDRTDVLARGLCRACYQFWRTHFSKTKNWIEIQCPVCGVLFPTKRVRKYCSTECYCKSDTFKAAREKYRNKMNSMRITKECLECGKNILLTPSQATKQQYADGKKRREKKFCNNVCFRKFFADRFDRAVAEYAALEIPCSYDEFLDQRELPCIMKGCDWVGKHLSIHCNTYHGIHKDDLKAMAGFNRSTGLVGTDTFSALSAAAIARDQGSVVDDPSVFCSHESRTKKRGPMRAEGKEHIRKSAALRGANRIVGRKPTTGD